MANGKQKWVSDIIGNDYKQWKNEFVILDCGTGCGKTYFCLNVLGEYVQKNNKSMLYLCNRSKLRDQVYQKIKSLKLTDTIRVSSYQALQRDLKDNKQILNYDYIIADECHYFMTDALFNDFTDISYDYVMNQTMSVVILVSATAKSFFKCIVDDGIVKDKNHYVLEKDFTYVDKLYFYQKDELVSIIDDILDNEADSKIIVFCNSGERILEMNSKYGNRASYYCSKSAKDEKLKQVCGWIVNGVKRDVNDCIRFYSEDLVTFDGRILFTTSVLDNGIDLKDECIKHVFTEIVDVDTMIQSLGRKRNLNKSDTCIFYVREYQDKGIQGFINKTNYHLEPVRMYKENYSEFYNQYGNRKKRKRLDKNDIFYSSFKQENSLGTVKVNECKYRKYLQNHKVFCEMKELGYIGYLEWVMPDELVEKSEHIVVNVEQIDKFKGFLESIEGKRLYSDDKKYIKKEFETIGVKLRYTGINTFNGALDDIYIDYPCRFYDKDEAGKSYKDKRRTLDNGLSNPNRDKCYWILENRNK